MTVKSLFLSAGGATQNWDEGKFIVQRVVDRKSPLEVFSYEFDVENMLDSIAKINLKAGDRLFLPSDPFAYRPELITIMGSGVYNPGQYPVNQSGETLLDFINRVILVSDRVQWSGARFYRVKSGSKYPISLDFEKVLNQGPGSTIQLKSGDIIDIPEKEFTVNVQGEVISKGHVLWNKNFDYEDYITYAGGYTRFGDEDRVLIILANGTRVKADDYNGSITPGSQIIVNFKPEDEPINWGAIFTGTVSALGSVAAVVLTIVLINNQVSN